MRKKQRWTYISGIFFPKGGQMIAQLAAIIWFRVVQIQNNDERFEL